MFFTPLVFLASLNNLVLIGKIIKIQLRKELVNLNRYHFEVVVPKATIALDLNQEVQSPNTPVPLASLS